MKQHHVLMPFAFLAALFFGNFVELAGEGNWYYASMMASLWMFFALCFIWKLVLSLVEASREGQPECEKVDSPST